MDPLPPPLAFLLLLFSGWINRQQQAVIDYMREENRILRAAYSPKRVRLTDDQRRRLAVTGKALGRRRLADVAGSTPPIAAAASVGPARARRFATPVSGEFVDRGSERVADRRPHAALGV
jgi:hypothetical protein